MATLSFLINGTASNQTKSMAWVTIEETTDGALLFKVKQLGSATGNVRGVYFDIADESILSSLNAIAVPNDSQVNEETVNCLKNGTDASHLCISHCNQDEVNGYNFTLQSRVRALSLCDFSQIQLDYSGDDYGNSYANTNDGLNHRWLYLRLFQTL